MIYFLTEENNNQLSLFEKIAELMSLDYQVINFNDKNLKIAIFDETVLINDRKIEDSDCFYINNIENEFPFVPNAAPEDNYRYFSDSFISMQQRKSQEYSVLSVISRKYKVINKFEQNFYSKIDVLEQLKLTGLNIAVYYLTNSAKYLLETKELFSQSEFFWSCVENQAPLKRIPRKDILELIPKDNDIPYLFYKIETGLKIRIWLLKGKPLLAAVVSNPKLKNHSLSLEKYEYISKLDFFREDAFEIYKKFNLDFMEIYGVITSDNKLIIYGLDMFPIFTELDKIGKEWIAGKILEDLSGEKSSLPLPEKGERKTVFLSKMLEVLVKTAKI